MSHQPILFGKYILLEKFAAGGMAEIFLARSPSVDGISKFVAMKRILPQFSDNEDFIRMFKDEAKIVINLSHNNIVPIFEFGIESGQFFLVMDYVEGKNLRQILNQMKKQETQFTVEQIVYITKEVAGGLDHAHRCLDSSTGKPLNITHRDISPQNIMVSFDGSVKIIDFGIAKAESQIETTRAGTLKGKFGYMSPEQAEEQPIDLRTDIFSLGIVLWEMLANERLFIANNVVNTLRKIRECKIPDIKKFNPNIHPELEKIISKTLSKDRNLRYQTAAALHRDLNRFINRQYPDFSSHDFSISVKTLFAEEILNTRKKLVEYSNVSLDNLTSSNLSSAQQPVQPTAPKASIEPTNTSDVDEPTETSFDDSTRVTKKIDLSPDEEFKKDQTSDVNFDYNKINSDLERNTQITNSRFNESLHRQNNQSSNRKSKFNNTIVSTKNLNTSKPLRTFLVLFLVVSVLGLAGISYFNVNLKGTPLEFITRFLPPEIIDHATEIGSSTPKQLTNTNVSLTPTEPTAPINTGPDLKSQAQGYIVVQSQPSGAEIYIDGQNTGFSTPAKINVPSDNLFSLTLKRDGFVDYSKSRIDLSKEDQRKILATLTEASIGYLNIDVIPPKNVQVFINGKSLKGERLPIRGYAVPTSNKIVVEAYNPFTKKRVREVVTVQKNKRKSISIKMSEF